MALTETLSQVQSFVGSWLPIGGKQTAHRSSQAVSKEIKIKTLYVHPIKSCRGTSVPFARYTKDGLEFDRNWLIIDGTTRKFCTARDLSQMVLIEPHMDQDANELRIKIPLREKGKGDVTVTTPLVPTEEQLGKMELIEDITIWMHKVDGYAVSPEADEALSQFFGKPVRLVRKGPSARPSGPDDRRNDATLNFQDFYPLLVANEASIHHVQQTLLKNVYPSFANGDEFVDVDKAVNDAESQARSEGSDAILLPSVRIPPTVELEYWTPEQIETLPIIRFRPNIVLESTVAQDGTPKLHPWEEDGFVELEIFDAKDGQDAPMGADAKGKGKVGVSCMARCARCTVTCIDPETGRRDPHLPYKALQGFRQVDPTYKKIGKPSFGVLSAISEGSGEHEGVLRVGDVVRVTATMDPDQRVSTAK